MTLRPGFVRFLEISIPFCVLIVALGVLIPMLPSAVITAWNWNIFIHGWIGTFLRDLTELLILTAAPWMLIFGGAGILHALLNQFVFRNDLPEDILRIERVNDHLRRLAARTGLFLALFICLPQALASFCMTVKLSDLSDEFLRTASCPGGYSVQADDLLIERRDDVLRAYGFTILNRWWVVSPSYGDCEITARGPYIWTVWSYQ